MFIFLCLLFVLDHFTLLHIHHIFDRSTICSSVSLCVFIFLSFVKNCLRSFGWMKRNKGAKGLLVEGYADNEN